MHIASLMKILVIYSSNSPETKIWTCLGQVNSVKIRRNLPISNPKPDLLNVNAYSKFGENPLLFTRSYSPEMKIWACLGQITPSKIEEICPLAIPNQISTTSLHVPSLVKIHWCLLKFSSGNEKRTDGHMDDQRETIIPCHYCVAGYKNGNGTMCPTRSEKFRTSENFSRQWPMSNWIPAINAHTKFGKNPLIFSQVIVQKENTGMSLADSAVKNWQNLPISNPKPDPHIINAHTKFGKNPLIFTQVIIWKKK